MLIRVALLAFAFLLTGCPEKKPADDPKPSASAEPAEPASESDKSGTDKAGTEKKEEGGW